MPGQRVVGEILLKPLEVIHNNRMFCFFCTRFKNAFWWPYTNEMNVEDDTYSSSDTEPVILDKSSSSSTESSYNLRPRKRVSYRED
jgi:hypothetical protein